jgi:prolyl-tRNA editing enzyme YbaK/EbsC (Cys-tRNA(Pro) deacylase)
MAILQSLKRLLDDNHVAYEVHTHRLTFTAKDTAVADGVPSSEMAKVLVLRGHDRLVLAVVPASRTLELDQLREAVGDPDSASPRAQFTDAFPHASRSHSALRWLFDMPVWVDDRSDARRRRSSTAITADRAHRHQDFVRLAKPQFGEFSRRGDVL